VSKVLLTSVFVAVMALTHPSLAQQRPDRPPLSQIDESLIGLPVLTSDGIRVGVVAEVGVDDDEAVVIAEIDQLLGIGSMPVAIPADMFVQNNDAIELTITASELRASLLGSDRR
jgi:PRC-barrel domain